MTRCAYCDNLRPLAELLAVRQASDGALAFYVCRPSLDTATVVVGACFRAKVGSVAVHAIAAAR